MESEELRQAAQEMADRAASLFARGYSFGTAGNISVRVGDTVLCTPTNSSFAEIDPDRIARVSLSGEALGGAKASKEMPFHLAAYEANPETGAVVHLHSTYATAVSCLDDLDVDDALPVLTPYYAMRLPNLPVVPYIPPGDPQLGVELRARIGKTKAVLLRNHGPITVGRTLFEAVNLAEELEEQAKLYLMLGDRGRRLTAEQIAELRRRFQ